MARAMKVAIVDDEADMRQSISQWLALSGFDTETFPSAEEALKSIGPEFPGVVVSVDNQAIVERYYGFQLARSRNLRYEPAPHARDPQTCGPPICLSHVDGDGFGLKLDASPGGRNFRAGTRCI